jgi:hypothetical protein
VIIFEDQNARRLVGLCKLLQKEAGNEPFFLSCRKAAQVLAIDDHRLTAAWLLRMVEARILELIKKGAGLKASRYRYLPTSG